jgi:hypothetical protein
MPLTICRVRRRSGDAARKSSGSNSCACAGLAGPAASADGNALGPRRGAPAAAAAAGSCSNLKPALTALERDAAALADPTRGWWLVGRRTTHYPKQLSGGEQQRVAIARAIAGEPKLLMADEPTGNLDNATGAEVADLMFRLNREHGTTLLLVTHDAGLAGRCARRLSLAAGRLVGDERLAGAAHR